jgi:hypothetical protein
MELEGSLRWSQETPLPSPYPESDQSRSYHLILSL